MGRIIGLIASILCLSFAVNAQVLPIYTNLHLSPSKDQPFKNFEKYDLGELIFYNGTGKESKYFYIIDKSSGAKVFELDEKDSKARRYVPTFLGDEETGEPFIIAVSLEGDYSWGSHILILEDGKVYNPGYLQYGIDNFNFASIGLHSQFEKHDDWYLMFFQEDATIINFATEDLVEGSEIEFKITKDKITRFK